MGALLAQSLASPNNGNEGGNMAVKNGFNLDDHKQAGNVLVNSLDSLQGLMDTIGEKHPERNRQAEQLIRHIERSRMALLNVTTALQLEMEKNYPQARGARYYRHGVSKQMQGAGRE